MCVCVCVCERERESESKQLTCNKPDSNILVNIDDGSEVRVALDKKSQYTGMDTLHIQTCWLQIFFHQH